MIQNDVDISGFANAVRARMTVSFRRSIVRMMSTSPTATQAVVDDALFSYYKPTCAFLFPGQVKMHSLSISFSGEIKKGPVESDIIASVASSVSEILFLFWVFHDGADS